MPHIVPDPRTLLRYHLSCSTPPPWDLDTQSASSTACQQEYDGLVSAGG